VNPDEKKPPFRPSRLTALLITAGVGVAAVHDQGSDGSLSPTMAGLLLVLIAFWSGRGGDRLLEKWFEK
jgi:hypothetical protein